MRRVAAVIKDAVRIWRKDGFLRAFGFMRSRVYLRSDTLLYELWTNDISPELPADWRIRVVRSAVDCAGMDLLRKVGGGLEQRYFRREAVVHVMCIGGEPVARIWYFPNNPLARKLGPNTVYWGDAFVRPEWRGQGIQGLLSAYCASQLPKGTRVIFEVAASNVASQKGVAKAGCVVVGRLRMIVFLGQIINARLDLLPLVESPSQ